jgi:DNA adenine methylase
MEWKDKGTFATMFSGGGLFDMGAQAAGLTPLWAVERNPDIATVYRANHPTVHLLVSDVCDVDYASLPVPGWLHASPVCTNASQAKQTGSGVQETWTDMQTANAVCQALELLPRVFSLENVWGYRLFDAFRMITQHLRDLGYAWDFWHLNAADYGVPQTRKRLILVAKHDRLPPNRPEPTHRNGGDLFLPPWVSWYDALADLIPSLPPSELADWQVRRLRDNPATSFLVNSISSSGGKGYREEHEPAYTVMPQPFRPPRAVLVAVNGEGSTGRSADAPAATISASHSATKYRAVLVISAYSGTVAGAEGRQTDRPPTVFFSPGPSGTVLCQSGARQPWRAMLLEGAQGATQTGDGAGGVVGLTPRALARLQSIPDSYHLPDHRILACRIIGDGVPPLLARRIVEANAGGERTEIAKEKKKNVKPLISYYGGKQRISSRILEVVRTIPHSVYAEPFAGGAAVLFAKGRQPGTSEAINDRDERVTNLYRVCQEQEADLLHLLQRTPYSQSEHRKAEAILRGETEASDLRRAWAVVVGIRQGFANKMFGGWGTSITPRDSPAWANFQDALPAILARFRGVYVSCEDALRFIARWDTPGTLFYCDPPYPGTNCGHYKGYTLDDYQRLCDALDSIRGSYILSNYSQAIVPRSAQQRIEIAAVMSAAKDVNRKGEKRTEVLWVCRRGAGVLLEQGTMWR